MRVDQLDGLDFDRHGDRASSDLKATSAARIGNVRVSVSRALSSREDSMLCVRAVLQHSNPA